MKPDPGIFTPTEAAHLVWVRWSLCRRRPHLFYSEFAVRTPTGRRLGIGFTPSVGPSTAPVEAAAVTR